MQDHPHREHVAAAVEEASPDVFGAHVVGSSHHHAGPGHRRALHFCDAEVQDLDSTVVEHPYVGGLDVAMNDLMGVGEVETAQGLNDDIEALGKGESFA